MALFDWNDSYSVHVKVIDEQHKHLVGILNNLHDAMTKGCAPGVTSPLLQELAEYTQTHFAAEEGFMERAAYPGLRLHSGHHRELTKQVEDFVVRHKRGEVALSIGLMNFLHDWLKNHIMKEDKEYGPWLNEHGLQ